MMLTLGEFVLTDPHSWSPVQNGTFPPVRLNSSLQLSSYSAPESQLLSIIAGLFCVIMALFLI